MNQMFTTGLMLGSLLFIGCSTKDIEQDKTPKESKVISDVYSIVINKSIKECEEYNIVLDEKRTNDFMRRTPKSTIEEAAKETAKTPKRRCQFFAEETSLEKVEKVKEFSSRIIEGCQKLGVTLSEEGIHNKVRDLPFFIIKKGLKMEKEITVEECELMERKYK